MKKEITLCEFQTICKDLPSSRFYYTNQDGEGGPPFASIGISFPPPDIIPNTATVCFRNESEAKMIIRCIRRVCQCTEYGVTQYRFDCGYGDGRILETYQFRVV